MLTLSEKHCLLSFMAVPVVQWAATHFWKISEYLYLKINIFSNIQFLSEHWLPLWSTDFLCPSFKFLSTHEQNFIRATFKEILSCSSKKPWIIIGYRADQLCFQAAPWFAHSAHPHTGSSLHGLYKTTSVPLTKVVCSLRSQLCPITYVCWQQLLHLGTITSIAKGWCFCRISEIVMNSLVHAGPFRRTFPII